MIFKVSSNPYHSMILRTVCFSGSSFLVQYILYDVALLNLCCILQAHAYKIFFRDPLQQTSIRVLAGLSH